jgi:membrane dipeptidase
MVTETEAREICKSTIHFDGLNICNFDLEIFVAWHKGGITGVSFTCGLWEGFRGSIANIRAMEEMVWWPCQWSTQVFSTADVRTVKKEGKVAVLLSWQNNAGIEDNLDYLRVFMDLGVKKMQLTYNTQNYSGAGYTEENDSGLTGFGKEVVVDMARLGIVCDLSHVGLNTTKDWLHSR